MYRIDWSSDVSSSDLEDVAGAEQGGRRIARREAAIERDQQRDVAEPGEETEGRRQESGAEQRAREQGERQRATSRASPRSEERRGGDRRGECGEATEE